MPHTAYVICVIQPDGKKEWIGRTYSMPSYYFSPITYSSITEAELYRSMPIEALPELRDHYPNCDIKIVEIEITIKREHPWEEL
jgi:hypothetical protein